MSLPIQANKSYQVKYRVKVWIGVKTANIREQMKEQIPVRTGLRHVDSKSPTLFNILYKRIYIIREINMGWHEGINLQG